MRRNAHLGHTGTRHSQGRKRRSREPAILADPVRLPPCVPVKREAVGYPGFKIVDMVPVSEAPEPLEEEAVEEADPATPEIPSIPPKRPSEPAFGNRLGRTKT